MICKGNKTDEKIKESDNNSFWVSKPDFIKCRFDFTERFLIDAVREKAAREGIIIPQKAEAEWSGLSLRHYDMFDADRSAKLTWSEKIPSCCKTND
jgi:hypothetical protein